MTPRLAPVLSSADLPEGELWAALLDGEVYRVGECFSPVDEVARAANRSHSLMAILPERLIAEQHTAAWVLGACDTLRRPLELCSETSARARSDSPTAMSVREVVIDTTEFTWIAGFRVTTPLRTSLDLARFSGRFEDVERRIVANLAQSGGFGLAECADAIERRKNLPRKHQALVRLSSVFD